MPLGWFPSVALDPSRVYGMAGVFNALSSFYLSLQLPPHEALRRVCFTRQHQQQQQMAMSMLLLLFLTFETVSFALFHPKTMLTILSSYRFDSLIDS